MAPPTRFALSIIPTGAPRRLLTTLAAGFAAFMALTAVAPAQAPGSDPVIAKINGVEIRQSDLNLAEEDIGRDMPVNDEAGKRDYLVNYLTDMVLIAKAAEAKKNPRRRRIQAASRLYAQ